MKTRAASVLIGLALVTVTAYAKDAVTDPAFREAIAADLAAYKRLPPSTNASQRTEKVSFDGSVILYEYTMVALTTAEIRAVNAVEVIRPDIKHGLCSSAPNMTMMKAGATFRYIYRGKDGGIGADFTVTGEDCVLDLGLPRNLWPPGMSRRVVPR